MNFQSLSVNNENILRLRRTKNLTIEGKVLVFKSLAISQIVHLSLITKAPHAIINQLNVIWKKTSYGMESYQPAILFDENFRECKSASWLPHSQLLATVEGAAASLHLIFTRPEGHQEPFNKVGL